MLLRKLSNPGAVRNYDFMSCRGLWFLCREWTLLHHAAMHEWGDVCKLLVEKYNCEQTTVDDDGMSRLHIACLCGSENSWSVKYLITLLSVLRQNNDKDTQGGCTPLHYACEWGMILGSCSVIEILLENNAANITEVDKAGCTPLELLCKHPRIYRPGSLCFKLVGKNMGGVFTPIKVWDIYAL